MAQQRFHWLPNALTISRIVLIPVLVWAILGSSPLRRVPQLENLPETAPLFAAILAISIFIYCMITDFLDGYIARKLNLVSNFGRMLDPIADKLLVAACLITICIVNFGAAIILIPSLIIIGRDIFVSGIREHAANSNIVLSPTKLAKWKTACEMLAILLFLTLQLGINQKAHSQTSWVLPPPNTSPVDMLGYASLALLWLAAILSAYTGFHYFRSALKGEPTG